MPSDNDALTADLKTCRIDFQNHDKQSRSIGDSYAPATGEVIGHYEIGTSKDAEYFSAVAQESSIPWSRQTAVARANFLYRWAEIIETQKSEAAQLVSREVGKPISEAMGEANRAVAILKYFANQAVLPQGELIPAQLDSHLQFSENRPLGVVGLITPWNFPLAIPLWKIAPAIAFGNTVIIKPSEYSPHGRLS